MALNVASPEKGRLLFRSVGCLGCHGEFDPGATGVPVAPDLAGVVSSRKPEALVAFLQHPKGSKAASRHRPDLRLTTDEAAHLAAYLAEDPAPLAVGLPLPPAGDARRGEALAERLRCASCHAVSTRGKTAERPPLLKGAPSRAEAGCLANEPAADSPRFAINAEERDALREYVGGLSRSISTISGTRPGALRPDPGTAQLAWAVIPATARGAPTSRSGSPLCWPATPRSAA